MATETIELACGGEVSEATAALRWVPKSMLQAMDFKLQQAHRIYVVDKDGRHWGSRIEWRDVPIEMNP